MTKYFIRHAPVFKALSDETRLKIVQMLTCETMNANSILECFSITQPSLSYHMKILTRCGLVRARRQGGCTVYSVDPQKLKMVIELMDEFLTGTAINHTP